MAATERLRLRVSKRLLAKLNKLSKSTGRATSRLAIDAIEEWVDDEMRFVAAVEEGLRDANAGRVVPHEDVVKWVKSWGTRSKLKRPMTKISAKRRA